MNMAGKTNETTENNDSSGAQVVVVEALEDILTSAQEEPGSEKGLGREGELNPFRFESLPEMVETLSSSPVQPCDENCMTDQENLSDEEGTAPLNEGMLKLPENEGSGDEGHTDVEDLEDPGTVATHEEDWSPALAKGCEVKMKRVIEETLADTNEVAGCWETDEETLLCNDPDLEVHSSTDRHRTGRKLCHRRQRSQSQPAVVAANDSLISPRSANSEHEFVSLSNHVRAVLRELNSQPRKLRSVGSPCSSIGSVSKKRFASRESPYCLATGANKEKLLKQFFTMDDAESLTDEGEFLILPGPQGDGQLVKSLSGLDLDSDGGATDMEELALDPLGSSPGGQPQFVPFSAVLVSTNLCLCTFLSVLLLLCWSTSRVFPCSLWCSFLTQTTLS